MTAADRDPNECYWCGASPPCPSWRHDEPTDSGHAGPNPGACCEPMTDAVSWSLVEIIHGEVVLPRRPLPEINPTAEAGNVLTGETCDPADFSLTLALSLCPWCGTKLKQDDDDASDW